MDLSNLSPAPGSVKSRKRVGRGPGSGLGKTSGRGHKGKGARSGGNVRPGYEGGQMPLQRRLPKRGFKSLNRTSFAIVNLRGLEQFENGTTVDPAALVEHGLVRRGHLVKVLGAGDLTKKLTVKAHKFSESAKTRIESAGGAVEVLPGA
jgi:large subunit ribosomal protein L15